MVFVSSEAHHTANSFSKRAVSDYIPYTVSSSLQSYAYTKWLILASAFQLARRINQNDTCRIKITAICPGPVNTDIARHAPAWLLRILAPLMALFFADPLSAAKPIVRLLLDEPNQPASPTLPISPFSPEASYYHMWVKKQPRPDILDRVTGEALWSQTEKLLEKLLPNTKSI